MKNKIILLTGATSGIGKAATTEFAKRGANVVITARDKDKGAATVSEIKAISNNTNVDFLICDLSFLSSIQTFSENFKKQYKKINVLVNCAAVFTGRRILTKDDLEMMFATNYLGPFLLTNLLLDEIKAGKPARIINVTANSPLKPKFDDLQGEKKFNPGMAFGTTKAENLLFTYELARKLQEYDITVNAYHPGVTRGTSLMSHAPFYFRWAMNLASPFLHTPEQAARGLVDAALDEKFNKTTGELIDHNGKPMKDPLRAEIAIQGKLWKESMKLTQSYLSY